MKKVCSFLAISCFAVGAAIAQPSMTVTNNSNCQAAIVIHAHDGGAYTMYASLPPAAPLALASGGSAYFADVTAPSCTGSACIASLYCWNRPCLPAIVAAGSDWDDANVTMGRHQLTVFPNTTASDSDCYNLPVYADWIIDASGNSSITIHY